MLQSKDVDLLHGPIFGKIFAYTLPLIVTNLIQMLYNAADIAIAGLSGVAGAIGALGTTTSLIHLIIGIFNGMALGSGIIVARYIGEGDGQKVKKAVHTSVIISLYSGILCMAIGFFACGPVLSLMGDEGHILELASTYTRIYFLGVPFLSITNFLIAIFRAKGDTETPLKILISSGLLNVVLNFVFVVYCGMDVDGVAIATSLSNLVSASVLTYCLVKDKGVCHMEFSALKTDKKCLKEILRNGVPAGIQGSMFSLSNIIIQSNVISVNNSICPGGSLILDGSSAAASLESIASAVTSSICQTSTTFTSQSYGAKMYDRLKKVCIQCAFIGLLLGSFTGLFFLLTRTPLLKLYSITNPVAKNAANTRMLHVLSLYFIYGVMEAEQGLLRGMNKSIPATVTAIAGIGVFRVIYINVLAKPELTIGKIFTTYPLSWFLVDVVYTLMIVRTVNHLKSSVLIQS